MTVYLSGHLDEIRAAAARIAPHIRRTPSLTTDLDPELVLKPESLQVTGSFKVRGAFNAVLSLLQREPSTRGVIAVSSGNHAQAVALAARGAGIRALILIPEDANPAKIAATRALGAEVITEGVTFANREQLMSEQIAATDLVPIHPFDNWDIIHGQGTAALELLEDHPDLDLIATPVGGGGLLSGTALAAKALRPQIRVVGVEPAAADDAARTLASGAIVHLDQPPATIADGVRTMSIGRRNYEVMVERGLVDGIVTVSEDEIGEGVRTAWSRLRLAVEPTGALPLAAYAASLLGAPGRTGLVLSGGNADLGLVARLLNIP